MTAHNVSDVFIHNDLILLLRKLSTLSELLFETQNVVNTREVKVYQLRKWFDKSSKIADDVKKPLTSKTTSHCTTTAVWREQIKMRQKPGSRYLGVERHLPNSTENDINAPKYYTIRDDLNTYFPKIETMNALTLFVLITLLLYLLFPQSVVETWSRRRP